MNSRIPAVFFEICIINIFRICFTEKCYNLILKQDIFLESHFERYSKEFHKYSLWLELGVKRIRISKHYSVDALLIWTMQNQKQHSSHLRPLIQARCSSVYLEQSLEAEVVGHLTKSRSQRPAWAMQQDSISKPKNNNKKIFDSKTSQKNLKSS